MVGMLVLLSQPAGAVTVAEAVSALNLLKTVEAMSTAERAEYIAQHRSDLNNALMVREIVGMLGRTVEATSAVSERTYNRKLVCIPDDDDDDEEGQPFSVDLPKMAIAFKADMRHVLGLADSPETEAKLNQVDIVDVIANRMVADLRCPGDAAPSTRRAKPAKP